jgi:RNA polymerase sigma factor (sigma-70 family)
MGDQEEGGRSYEDWGAVMETLLRDTPDNQQIAFAKLNRLISGFLADLRAWDHREEWEDLRQIILMKLVKSFSQGQLRESKAFVAYTRTITRNEFYDFLKARLGTDVVEPPDVGSEESIDETTALSIRSALQNLPDEQRRAVEAVYLEEKTYEEAAAVTAIPLGSLKRYLRLALTRLREQLFEAE